MKKSFRIMRHAEKNAAGSLSESGRESVIQKAQEYFQEIESYPPGTVMAFMPSNIGRTQETRDLFEQELTRLIQAKGEGYQVLDVNDVDEIKSINQDTPEKTLITGLAHSSLIGFSTKEGNQQGNEFVRRQKDFQGNEDLIGKLWSASPEELPQIKREIADKYPNLDLEDIKPSNFHDTPEQAALPQLRFMLRMLEISRKQFPDNPVRLFGVSHNTSTDFVVMKLLGQPLNSTTIENWGGKIRQYLESHSVDIEDGKANVKFREEQRELGEEELQGLVEELERESEQRKKLWQEAGI